MPSSLSWSPLAMPVADKQKKPKPAPAVSRDSAQRASVAQLLLVARLKARNRRDLAMDTLERGAHVMWVTCKSWFASGQPPAASDDDNNPEDKDAHRDR
ncbi:MAG: hypothetical protein C0428_01810 [Polaromonas sp.]|jgi:hypothetical protein|nr:hypothetical protein [Polaromonas sp.]